MDILKAECSVCGAGIESYGRDESSRNAIKTFQREHEHHLPSDPEQKAGK